MIKFCVCIDIYKIHVVANARYFWSILNRVMALDRSQNLFFFGSISCELIRGFRSNFVFALVLTICRFMIKQYCSLILNRVMALDRCQNFICAQYLVNQLIDFDKIL